MGKTDTLLSRKFNYYRLIGSSPNDVVNNTLDKILVSTITIMLMVILVILAVIFACKVRKAFICRRLRNKSNGDD